MSTQLHNSRTGKFLAALLTVIAAAASIATGSETSGIYLEPVSGTVVVSHANPEVRIPFVASAAGLGGSPLAVEVTVAVDWSGAEERTVIHGGELSLLTADGQTLSLADHRFCSSSCTGANELLFRWPIEATDGEMAISWTIGASADFDSDRPPTEAQISLEVGGEVYTSEQR